MNHGTSTMSLLRNRRGRIRCAEEGCQRWAVHFDLMPTDYSVAEYVPFCPEHSDDLWLAEARRLGISPLSPLLADFGKLDQVGEPR